MLTEEDVGVRTTSLAVLFLVLLATGVAAQDGLVVQEILWEGNLRDESTLEYLIQTKEGQRLSESVLAEDVSTLHRYFESVTTREEAVPGGIRITFVLKEYPALTSVVFRGFDDVKEEKWKEVLAGIKTKKGYSYAEYTVQLDRSRLEDFLRKEGYYFAEVRAAEGVYQGGRQVVFTAIAGPEVEIDDIRFVGNTFLDEGDIEDWLLSKESTFWTKGRFVRKTLDQDLITLANRYRSEGFLDVIVELQDLTFSPDKEEVTITIGIQENEPYVIDAIEIEGGKSFPADRAELLAQVKVEPGERRREAELFENQQRLRRFYLENAYYNVVIRTDKKDDPRTRRTTVTFKIEEGSPVRIRRVDITGNTVTRDRVVRRNLSVHPGGPLNSVELAKSASRLEATGFFELGSVKSTVKDTDDPDWKDLLVDLKEGRTGSLRFTVGLTSDLGILALIQFKKKNFDYMDVPERFSEFFEGTAFTGGGQSLDLILQPGSDYSQYRLAFTEPWFINRYLFTGPSAAWEETPYSFGIDLFHTIFGRFDYDSKRTGVSLSTGKAWRKPGKRFDDVVRASVFLRIENIRLENLSSSAPPNAYVYEGLNRENRIGLSLAWMHVDLPASPGAGFETDLRLDFAGGPLQGEIDYWKAEGGFTYYTTLYTLRDERRHILELRGRLGGAKPYGDSERVPLFDRFYAGGRDTIRGFAFGTVGPRAEGNPFTNKGRKKIARSLEDGTGDPMGGEALWLARAQYGFPLYDQFLRGVVFVDAGNVADNWSSNLWSKSRIAAGFGVRVKLPFFGPTPIAFDFAWPLNDELGDDTQVISFSIDRPF